MLVSQVTKEDATACAQLIRVITRARFDGMTADDAQALVSVKHWVNAVANLLAQDLKGISPAAPEGVANQGMKIKAMGPIGSSKPTKKKK